MTSALGLGANATPSKCEGSLDRDELRSSKGEKSPGARFAWAVLGSFGIVKLAIGGEGRNLVLST
jgi:hypothetical protein